MDQLLVLGLENESGHDLEWPMDLAWDVGMALAKGEWLDKVKEDELEMVKGGLMVLERGKSSGYERGFQMGSEMEDEWVNSSATELER